MKKLLTVQDLSDLLQVSPKTIYQWTHTGFVPHYRFPKGIRFSQEKIERWLANRAVKGRSTLKIELPLDV